MTKVEHKVKKFVDLFKESKNTVVFSGAGMSTESGLKDFRSAGGMWRDRDPMQLASVEAMQHQPAEFIQFYQWRIQEMLKHRPNEGQRILAKWERQGLIKGIITQNVENYHEQAGTKSIAKLHGDLGTLRCNSCHESYESKLYLPPISKTICNCGGFIRPNIVLFGERLPEAAFVLADQLIAEAQLFIVLGSSLQVSPANQLPLFAKQNGAKLIIVNLDPTPLDSDAHLVLHAPIGEVLCEVERNSNR